MENREAIKRIERIYDERVRSKLDTVRAPGQWGTADQVQEICEEIDKKIQISREHTVLEIGCGSGVLGKWVNKRCAFYCGFDISFLMLKKFVEYDSNKPSLIQAVSEAIPIRDHFFDVVIMNSVAPYFPTFKFLKNTLKEIERIALPNATIFLGENITQSGVYWEYTWFQNLNPVLQFFVKPYIKTRMWLARLNSNFGGKWKDEYLTISPDFIKDYFREKGNVTVSDSSAVTIKQKRLGENWKGNRRIDFVIKLESRNEINV